MNKEELILKLKRLKKTENQLENALSLGEHYAYGFGCGYNQAIDEVIKIIEDGEQA